MTGMYKKDTSGKVPEQNIVTTLYHRKEGFGMDEEIELLDMAQRVDETITDPNNSVKRLAKYALELYEKNEDLKSEIERLEKDLEETQIERDQVYLSSMHL